MDVAETGSEPVTAFVLAGGGSLGAVEVGMLLALMEWGERPVFLVGASAGAINAVLFAAQPTLDGVLRMASIWQGVRRRDVFPVKLSGVVAGIFGGSSHLVSSEGLRHLLGRHLPYSRLEEALLPVHVVATDVVSGREVVLSRGSAIDSVLASTAIPGVFSPVMIDGHLLVDGGLSNNAPISVAVAKGAKRVIVLPTGFACARRAGAEGVVPRAMHAISMLIASQLLRDAEHWHNSHIELRIVPSICPLRTSPYDFTETSELISRAHVSTQAWLERGGLEVAEIPKQLGLHHHFSSSSH